MQIDANEPLPDSLDDVKVAPVGLVSYASPREVDFQHHLVHVVQILHRESAEPRPLSALNIDLHRHVLALQLAVKNDVSQGGESSGGRLLADVGETGTGVNVATCVAVAGWVVAVGAVVLVVGHQEVRGQSTAEVVPPLHSQVNEGLRVFDEVFAHQIAPIPYVSVTLKLAVGVLCVMVATL